MATTTKSTKVAAGKTSRYNELKKMLEERRRELLSEVQGKIRDVRAEGGNERDVLDQGESSEVRHPGRHRVRAHPDEVGDAQQDQQKRSAVSTKGPTATASECGEEIAHPRLQRAAVRGPLQGLRRGARERRAARACARAQERVVARSSSTCRTKPGLDRLCCSRRDAGSSGPRRSRSPAP